MTSDDLIFHICREEEWKAARIRGEYIANSLETEGFIHCSKRGQLLQVVNRVFKHQKDLGVLCIDPELVSAQIIWEFADGEVFPHVYGALNLDSVVSARNFSADDRDFFLNLCQE